MNEETQNDLDGIMESLRKLAEELTELEQTLASIAGDEGSARKISDRID